MKNILNGLAALFILTIVYLVVTGKIGNTQLLNPLGWQQTKEQIKEGTEVVGFLPTWMIGKTKMYGPELDQLIFLGVEVEEDGSLVWDGQSNKINNQDYLNLKNNVKKHGGKNILGIKLFKDEELEVLVASSEARIKLVTELTEVVRNNNFDGVNVDFEYMGDATRILDDEFLGLLDEIKEAGLGEISLDVFANTIIKGDEDRLVTLLNKIDKVIVMAYDFHGQGSNFSGSVAPINAETGERSISEVVEKIEFASLDREKIVMAYPLYGYEWITTDELIGSETIGGGRMVSFNEGVGITGEKWDELSMTPWITWTEQVQRSRIQSQRVGRRIVKKTVYFMVDQSYQTFYENSKSLQIKVDLAKQSQLGGIGFWALGYEGKESNLIEGLGI